MIAIVQVPSPASAHSADTDRQAGVWHFVDEPDLRGPSRYWQETGNGGWHDGEPFQFTYGIGNDDEPDNWAVWNMGHRHGRQPVWVWIPQPSNHADRVEATVLYRIYKNGKLLDTKRVDQKRHKGWYRLGTWWFRGADVRVEVYDNETTEHYNRNDRAASRIGVDAVAMRCFWNCGDTSEWDDLPARVPYPHPERCQPAVYDVWGMEKGQCTSYVAFRLHEDGIPFRNSFEIHPYFPLDGPHVGKFGEASEWIYQQWRGSRSLNGTTVRFYNKYWSDLDGQAYRIKVNDTPAAGAVAYWAFATTGHVGYVESVTNNGFIMSDMNGELSQRCTIVLDITVRRNSEWTDKTRKWPDAFIHFERI